MDIKMMPRIGAIHLAKKEMDRNLLAGLGALIQAPPLWRVTRSVSAGGGGGYRWGTWVSWPD